MTPVYNDPYAEGHDETTTEWHKFRTSVQNDTNAEWQTLKFKLNNAQLTHHISFSFVVKSIEPAEVDSLDRISEQNNLVSML